MGNQRVTTNISTGDVEIITGVGDLLAENNLSDVDSATTSRTNLGLEIGTDVQEWSADLDTLATGDGSPITSGIAQTAVTGLASALNARAMAGGVYFDGTVFGTFSEPASLVDSVFTFTADITLDVSGGGMLFSQGGNSGGWFISIAPSGQIQFIAKQTGSTLNHFIETSNDSLEASRSYHVAVVVDFTTAARDVTFYVDGETFASTTDVAATGTYGESPPRNFGIGARDLGGSPSVFFEGTISNAAAFNTALTAAQIADLAEYGLTGWLARNPEYRRGSATALTSGTLEVGQRYRINTFVAGDDFTNVGGANVTGNEFTATGTTPTTWTNSSELEAVGAVAALPMDEGVGYQLHDISGNHNDALLSTTGFQHLIPKTQGFVRDFNLDANGATADIIDGSRDILPAGAIIDRAVIRNNDASNIAAAAFGLNRTDGSNTAEIGDNGYQIDAGDAGVIYIDATQDLADRRLEVPSTADAGMDDFDITVFYSTLP